MLIQMDQGELHFTLKLGLNPKTKKQLHHERRIDTRANALRAMLEQLGMDTTGSHTVMMNKIAKLIKEFDTSTSVIDSLIDVSDLVKFVNSKK